MTVEPQLLNKSNIKLCIPLLLAVSCPMQRLVAKQLKPEFSLTAQSLEPLLRLQFYIFQWTCATNNIKESNICKNWSTKDNSACVQVCKSLSTKPFLRAKHRILSFIFTIFFCLLPELRVLQICIHGWKHNQTQI